MPDLRSKDPNQVALRALMKNEKISKVLRDAYSSPIGSTARIRARKMMSVVKRTTPMDGMGGPGLMIPTQDMRLAPHTVDYSNLVILKGTPGIRVPIGQKHKEPVLDGAGGPGLVGAGMSAMSNFSFPSSYTSPQANESNFQAMAQLPQRSILGGIQGSTNLVGKVGGALTGAFGSLNSAIGNAATGLYNYGKAPVGSTWSQANQARQSVQTQPQTPYQGGNIQTNGAVYPGQFNNAGPVNSIPPAPQAPGGAASSIPFGNLKMIQPNTAQAQQAVTTAQQGANAAQQAAYSGGTTGGAQPGAPATPSAYQSIQDAVNSGMGPTMFGYQAMARGPEYLKTLPGFENMPTSALQGAPTLSGRIQDLDKALRTSYHLDELLGQYSSLAQQGADLPARMTDYIRGRDQFLNETNDMLDNFKAQSMTMDMSDPHTRDQANQYSNYLYELRGRQNKRYIEFLNTSIGEYNSKLDSVSGMYTTALDNYQRELTTKSAITQEEYNLMAGALSDMYNTVSNAPMQALQMQQLKAQIYASQMSAAKDAASMYGTGNDSYWKDLDKLKQAGIIDVNGRWNPSTSIDDAETYAALGIDPTNFFQAMRNVGRNSLSQPDKDGNLPDLTGIMSTTGSLLNNLNRLATYGAQAQDPLTVQQAMSAAQEVRDSAANALFANGILSASHGGTVKEAINYLGNTDVSWNPFSKGIPSRDKFVSTFKDKGLDQQFLDTLYTDFEGYKDNRTQYATYRLNEVDNGSVLRPYSDAEVVSNLAKSFADKLAWGSSQ